jgi:type IV pilus assembly protein PilE
VSHIGVAYAGESLLKKVSHCGMPQFCVNININGRLIKRRKRMNTRIYYMTKRRGFLKCQGVGGFTLVEVLITMAIMGILTAIAVPAYLGQREKAMRTEATTNLLILRQKMIDYYNENMCYSALPLPCADATYTYTNTPPQTLQTLLLTGFKPGAAADLFYDYKVVTTLTGQAFTATATGKTGTRVAGRVLSITDDNTKVGF